MNISPLVDDSVMERQIVAFRIQVNSDRSPGTSLAENLLHAVFRGTLPPAHFRFFFELAQVYHGRVEAIEVNSTTEGANPRLGPKATEIGRAHV